MKRFLYLCFLLNSLAYALPKNDYVDLTYDARGFIITKNDNLAYVATGSCRADSDDNKSEIVLIDLKGLNIINRMKIPTDGGTCINDELFLTKDEKKLYVNDTKSIFIIDTTQFKLLRTIRLEKDSYIEDETLQSPDKSKLYYNITTDWVEHDYRNFRVLDTQSDSFVDKIPNTDETCWDGCGHLAGTAISPDGAYIYEMPEPSYKKPQQLFSLDVVNKHSTLLGEFKNSILHTGLLLSKNGDTFYVSTWEDLAPSPTEDWYIYSINKNTMELKELYHAEHRVRAIELSDDDKQLYILDLRWRHKKITIVDVITGVLIKDIPMDLLTTDAKIISNHIYFTTMPGDGNESRFNVMALNNFGSDPLAPKMRGVN